MMLVEQLKQRMLNCPIGSSDALLLGEAAARIAELERALATYWSCKNGCINCPCTKVARAVLANKDKPVIRFNPFTGEIAEETKPSSVDDTPAPSVEPPAPLTSERR